MLEDMRVDLEGFSLSGALCLAPGRRVAVVGPSGAGKSTLLDVIAGFRRMDRGRVFWNDRDLTTLSPRERPVSMLFQDQNLFPHLDVSRNLALALRPDGRRLSSEQVARVTWALERMGLGDMGGRKPGALSGGQQARAALARVLLQTRPILLLDEPFAALGPALRAEMLSLVKEVAQEAGALTLLVSHDPADARSFAEDVVFIDGGLVHDAVETEQLFANPPDALKAYLG